MTDKQIIEMAKQAGDDWDHTLQSDKEFLQRFAQLVWNEVEGYYEDLLFHIEDAMRNEPQPYEIEKAVERIRSMKK